MNDNLPTSVRFLAGGASGMSATSILQPLDLIKTRMQMSGIAGSRKEHTSAFRAFLTITRNEGFPALYRGMSAALTRQATYTTIRLGVFTTLKQKYADRDGRLPFFRNLIFGIVSGATGAFFGTPADVALVRMTSDGRLPRDKRRGYKNVVDALVRIISEEGFLSLWRGCQPTIVRAMCVNAAQLTVYTQCKQMFLKTHHFKDDIWCHIASSTLSGFCACVSSLPADIVKTRSQNTDQNLKFIATFRNIIREEGFFALWKGFTPCYLRMGPHSVLLFVFLEQYQMLAKSILIIDRKC